MLRNLLTFHQFWCSNVKTKSEADVLRHLLSPRGKVCCASQQQVVGHRREVVDESQLVLRVLIGGRGGKHAEVRIRKAPGLLPKVDSRLAARGQEQCRLLRTVLAFGVGANSLHIITSNLMLRAIAATSSVSNAQRGNDKGEDLPLREGFVAANVSAFTSLATLAALGVTPSGWSSTRACHDCSGLLSDDECVYERPHADRQE